MYDLSLPPAGASPFRPAHQHSASDPAAPGIGMSMREQQNVNAALAMNMMQAHLHHPFNVAASPLPHAPMLYPHQFYAPAGAGPPVQDAYGIPRIHPAQYPNGAAPSPASYGSPVSAGSQNGAHPSGGPSANNRKLGLYKTELCRSWEEKGSCRYGPKCQFAHGEDEIRKVARHPKYKTEICRTFWVSGSCPYGKRCCFIHTELPTGGAPAASGTPPADTPTSNSSSSAAAAVGRERSLSTNSDPNDAPVSLLTRIANQRTADAHAAATTAAAAAHAAASVSTPTEGGSTPTYQFPQARPNSLRVDTTLDTQLSMKQNKSAYPYMNNHSLPKNNGHDKLISPGPVTAGPDLGRSASRFDAYNDRYSQHPAQTPTAGQQTPTNAQPSTALRHSFNGTESLALQTQLALSSGHSSPFGAAQAVEGTGAPSSAAATGGGGGGPNRGSPTPATHSRSESASGGPWGAGFARGLAVAPNAGSPWSGDLSVGSNRLTNERKWS
ncbi:hypothetical protein JB92DRAFT_1364905 [Gautieria morchelliformis]|nr:hypothetical protein JB92DRAFT_1364905 [Gautieria morchelliformis]